MQRTVQLTPPIIDDAHIKEKIICIRAHRERIFNVSTQERNGKLLFHNYGHGGAGWTFLFGCVHESLRQFQTACAQQRELTKKPIAIIGAGCHGLLTAIELTRKGHQVRILAKDTKDIPSHKAAGFFFPRARKCSTADEIETFLARGIESYQTYLAIMHGQHPFINHGPVLLPAYYGLEIDPGFQEYIKQGLLPHPQETMVDFGNGKTFNAMQYQTVFIQPAAIMQELQRNITELGVTIAHQEITDVDEIQEQIIFNCAGMGAKQLANDKRIVPVQGHLITLKNQPPANQLQYMINVRVTTTAPNGRPRDELIYYAPKDEGILGITFLRGQDGTHANEHEFERLLHRSQNFFGK